MLVGVVVAIGGVVIVVVVGWLRCNMLGELGRERDTEVCERERERQTYQGLRARLIPIHAECDMYGRECKL